MKPPKLSDPVQVIAIFNLLLILSGIAFSSYMVHLGQPEFLIVIIVFLIIAILTVIGWMQQ